MALARCRRPVMRLAGLVALLLVAWWTAACALIDTAVYPGATFAPPASGPPLPGPSEHWLDIDDGQRVQSWLYLPPGATATSPAPVVIFFHGNGELIDQASLILDGYLPRGVGVFLPEYRGYGRSGGKPSQAAIAQDMRHFRAWLVAQPGVDPQRIIYHGRSLGGGVACELARTDPPAAMILESAFTSVTAITGRLLIPPFLVRHPYRNDRVLADADWPILLMHGTRDSAIPVAHGRRNRKTADASGSPLVLYHEFDCDHNDLPPPGERGRYWSLIDQLLATR